MTPTARPTLAQSVSSGLSQADASALFRRPPDRLFDVGAGSAAYRRVGTGPDVLFVHGWPVTGATFRTLLPFLAEHVTCHIIDFPGAGSSQFTDHTPIDIGRHIETLRRVLDQLELQSVAVVAHDSGGLIARHALAGDPRVRAFALMDTEQPQGLTLRFKSFLAVKRMPGLAPAFGWLFGQRVLRRNPLALGGAFVDRKLLDGEFNEFFLEPIHSSKPHRNAAAELLRNFQTSYVDELYDVHRRINVPVHLVWGERDPFFPVKQAREMVASFSNAQLTVIPNAALFAHEERPAEVAAALLPTLLA
jgi:haloalkane dehalogenase